MIITGNQALKLVSSHSIVEAVPELLPAVEAFVQANKQWKPKQGCGDCSRGTFFDPVEKQALDAIASLSSEAVGRLKKHLGRRDLYVNVPQPGKPAIVKELK